MTNIYTDRQLDGILTNYHKLNSLLQNQRAAILHPWRETDTNLGGGSSGRLSNPTESAAVELMEGEKYLRLRKTMRAVKLLIQETAETEEGRIMQAYYFEGKHCDSVSERTMTNYRQWFRGLFREKLEEVENKSKL